MGGSRGERWPQTKKTQWGRSRAAQTAWTGTLPAHNAVRDRPCQPLGTALSPPRPVPERFGLPPGTRRLEWCPSPPPGQDTEALAAGHA